MPPRSPFDRFARIALFLYPLAVALWLAATHVPVIREDGFYYLKIAQQLAQGGGSTFDGVNPTNGYHPLWLFTLVPIFSITHDRELAVLLVTFLQGLLFALSTLLVYQTVRLLMSVVAASLATFTWVLFSFWNGLSGLEFSVHALGVACLAFLYLKWFRGVERPPASRYLVFGLIAALTFLARLETILLSGILGLFLLQSEWRSGLSRAGVLRLAAFSLPIVVTLFSYVSLNLLIFGHALPVSGTIRFTWSTLFLPADPVYQSYGWLAAKAFNAIWPLRILADWEEYPISALIFPFYLATGTFGIALIWLFAVLGSRRGAPLSSIRRVLIPWRPFILYSVLSYLAYALLYQAGFTISIHYYVVPPWLVALMGGFLFDRAWQKIASIALPTSLFRWARPVLLLALGVVWLCVPLYTVRSVLKTGLTQIVAPAPDGLRDAAQWIDTHLPDDAIIGVWNAGTIGYYSTRRIINLDGLVNSWEFYERDRYDLCSYWRKQNINFLVDVFDESTGYALIEPLYSDYSHCADHLELLWHDNNPDKPYHHRAYRIRW